MGRVVSPGGDSSLLPAAEPVTMRMLPKEALPPNLFFVFLLACKHASLGINGMTGSAVRLTGCVWFSLGSKRL